MMFIVVNVFFIFQPFNNWLDGAKEDLLDMFIVHSIEEIQVSENGWSVLLYINHLIKIGSQYNFLQC